jgi:hypothetical protein
MKKIFRVYPYLFSLAFFAILVVPLRGLNFNPHEIDEGFYGRARLIAIAANFRLRIGDRVFPKVLVGENHWLVFTGENGMDEYQNVMPLSDSALQKMQEDIDAVYEEYAARGIYLLIVIPPNKNTIYPEYIPEEIPVLGDESRLEQFLSYMSEHGRTPILDLRPVLMEGKKTQQVYYATDTHWNDYGAFLAYQEMMKSLSAAYPAIQPHSFSDFEVNVSDPKPLDLTRNMGATIWREPKISLLPRFETRARYKEVHVEGRKITYAFTGDDSLPNAVIYHDSFFFRMIPLLSEHFNRAVYIPNYLNRTLWSLSWVDEEDADVVIVEFTERYLADLNRLLSLPDSP